MSALVAAYAAPSASLSMRVTANAVTETVTASVTAGREYWLTGDGGADSSAGDGDLLTLLAAALEGHSEITTATVTLVDGRVRVTADVALAILWTDGATTLDPEILGFAGDTASATTIDAPSTCPLVWIPGDLISDDTRPRQRLVRGRVETLSGLVYTGSFGDAAKARSVGWRLVTQDRMLEEYAGTTYTAWETIDRLGVSLGVRVRIYEDSSTIGAGTGYGTYRVSTTPRTGRDQAYQYRWEVQIDCRADGAVVA